MSIIGCGVDVKDKLVLETDDRDEEPFIEGDLTSGGDEIEIGKKIKLEFIDVGFLLSRDGRVITGE